MRALLEMLINLKKLKPIFDLIRYFILYLKLMNDDSLYYMFCKSYIRVNGFLLNRLCHALLSGLKEVSYQNTKHINKNINQTQTNIKTQIKNILCKV